MKTTYLVYKQVDGVRQLVAATQEEWDAIMKENRGLPIGQRRCFMKDCFEDGDELDFAIDEKNGICNVQVTFSNVTKNLKVQLTRKAGDK